MPGLDLRGALPTAHSTFAESGGKESLPEGDLPLAFHDVL
jgi:hypothetical protein